MTRDEAMHWWFARVNFEVRAAAAWDLKLEAMRLLLERLGNPQHGLPIVHVAGSKGKGSTSAMLAAVLRHAGQRVGLFTSPHLVSVNERIQIDDVPIPDDELARLLAEIRGAAAAPVPGGSGPLDDQLTFFEIATAVGFLHFQRQRVDWAVLEVGLGGRFDSTNVCDPRLAVITSISLDHTQQLGNTLAEIAGEKAGIVKPGRPTVSGVVVPEARDVIRQACRERGSPLRDRGADFSYVHQPGRFNGGEARAPRVQVTTWRRAWPDFELRLLGEHQAANAAVVVAAVEELREQGVAIADEAVRRGLAGVDWPARLEIAGRQPLRLLDCAHNVASARALVDAVLTTFPLALEGRRLLIFAGSRDKDLAGMLAEFGPHFDQIFLTRFDSPRCVSPAELAQCLPDNLRGRHTVTDSPAAAWQLAVRSAGPNDLICATGSVFLAGELRRMLRGKSGEPEA
jgi:dihydrofolate synthase / folylpolyglutamate synthase